MAHYCSKGRGTRCNGRRATVPWDAFFEQSFFYCSLEVGSREYEKARKDQNCVVLDDGSVKAIKKIPRNYEVLLMGGHSEEHMGSTRSKVECVASRQQNRKKARIDMYEDRKL